MLLALISHVAKREVWCIGGGGNAVWSSGSGKLCGCCGCDGRVGGSYCMVKPPPAYRLYIPPKSHGFRAVRNAVGPVLHPYKCCFVMKLPREYGNVVCREKGVCVCGVCQGSFSFISGASSTVFLWPLP